MLIDLIALQDHYPIAIPATAFLLGSVIGSFLNVVVYRLPKSMMHEWHVQAVEIIEEVNSNSSVSRQLRENMENSDEPPSLVRPGSRCPHCYSFIRPWHNIPIISWVLLRGSCHACRKPISLRYPAVELATALLTVLVIANFGVSWQGLAACFFTWAMIALALIDFDTQLLPDNITLPFIWLGLIANYFGLFVDLNQAFIGAITGYLSLWTVYQLFKLATGKEGMGFGDFKMLAMLGAWLGITAIPLIIFLSSFAGALLGGILILSGRSKDKPLKFGPFLAVAGWIALMWGDKLVDLYLELAFQHV